MWNFCKILTIITIIKSYCQQSLGLVEVLPWQLDMTSQKEIRTEGLFAALNDCLYRLSSSSSPYLSLLRCHCCFSHHSDFWNWVYTKVLGKKKLTEVTPHLVIRPMSAKKTRPRPTKNDILICRYKGEPRPRHQWVHRIEWYTYDRDEYKTFVKVNSIAGTWTSSSIW